MRRIRPTLQMEAAECGAACLAMVLDAHGRAVELEQAREACGTSRDGVDVVALMTAAKGFGLEVKAVAREPETLAELPLPAILHWRFTHFVVLEGVSRGRFHLVDPAVGRRTVDRTEMDRSFTGLAVALRPGPEFREGGIRPSLMAQLLRHAEGSHDGLALVFLTGVLGLVPAVALAGAVQVFTDYVIGHDRLEWTLLVLLALAGATLAQAALAGVREYAIANLKAKIATVVGTQSFRHALFLPLSFFAQRNAGELVSRLRVGTEIGASVAGPLARLAPNAVTLVGLLAIVAVYDLPIAAALAATAFASIGGLYLLAHLLADRERMQHLLEARAGGLATSGFGAFEAFRTLGRVDLLAHRWIGAETEALNAEQRLGRLRALANLAPVATPLLLTLVVMLMGAAQVMEGAMGLGALLALQVLAGLIAAPVSAMARDLCDLQQAAGAVLRLDDLRKQSADPLAVAVGDTPSEADPEAPILALDRVSFAYGPRAPLFSDVSLELRKGEVVAIVGPSGVGKSTLARIAAGLVAPQDGSVRLRGRQLADWPRRDLRRALAYVPQTSAVFTGTLAENVSLFDTACEGGRVAEALRLAGVEHLLGARGGLRMPLSSQTPALSGGERQRVALARALVHGPDVVVLDETTSALDTVTEAAVLERLREAGFTLLIVTHRLGTMRRCDRTLRLVDGSLGELLPESVARTAFRASA